MNRTSILTTIAIIVFLSLCCYKIRQHNLAMKQEGINEANKQAEMQNLKQTAVVQQKAIGAQAKVIKSVQKNVITSHKLENAVYEASDISAKQNVQSQILQNINCNIENINKQTSEVCNSKQ